MQAPSFHLVPPDVRFETSFRAAFAEMKSESDRKAWVYLGESAYMTYFNMSFQDYVSSLLLRERQAPQGFVRDSVYWAIISDKIVGRISLRHELNDFLAKAGGHIGYIVRPTWRGQGVATEMLRQVLMADRARSIGKLLLTCDDDNVASEKTIVKNGGVLESAIEIATGEPKTKRFWIAVKQ